MSYRIDANRRNELYQGVGGFVARAFDSMLSPFAPRLVLGRQRARAEMLAYDMAQKKRTRRTQRAGSADSDLLTDLPQMRTNSRAMVRDDSAASALVRVLEDNIVGTGMRPQMIVDRVAAGLSDAEANAWNETVEKWFESIAGEIDATEADSFWEMQRQALRTMVVDGEFLLKRVFASDGSRRTSTAWEMIDADRLVDPHQGSTVDIRSGVEVGERQQAVAYWITPRHPDEMRVRWASPRLAKNQAERYAKVGPNGRPIVLHGFRRDRAGQTRGVPFLASSFGLVESMNDMLDAELTAARAAAKFCVFVRQTVEPGHGLQNEDGAWIEKLESGTIRYLNKGEQIESFSPNRPGNNFDPFVVRVLRSICAANGLPYEMVARDFGGMNYSNARVALIEARRGFEVLQQLLAEKFCQPIFASMVYDGVLSGELPAPRGFRQRPDLFLRALWQPPGWGWVDPVKEIEASRLAIENSLSTPQAEASRQGGDAEANLEQRARHLRKAREIEARYELPEGSLTKTAAQAQAPTPNSAPEDDEEEEQEEDQDE